MEVKCTVNWEQYLTQDIVDEMVSVVYTEVNTFCVVLCGGMNDSIDQ